MKNQETYVQLLLNKFLNPWNRYFSEKFEEFVRQPTTFRSIVVVPTVINTEIVQSCLQENILKK